MRNLPTPHKSQSQVISVLGAGLLTGAALQIIIPEGFTSITPSADEHAAHGLAGLVLTLGFLVMLIIDQAQTRCLPFCATQPEDTTAPHNLPHAHDGADPVHTVPIIVTASRHGKDHQQAASKVVVGLLIHAASDGLSLGAASLTGDHRLELVVAVAMILHKLPVAMGLGAYLQQTRVPWRATKRWLAMFAATMPVTTLITYWLLAAVPGAQREGGTVVPLCLLFSGGTVLYAATMHILPELMSAATSAAGAQHLTVPQMALFAAGALAPMALTLIPEGH